MHRQHSTMIRPPLLNPNHRVGCQPIVRMNHVKMSVSIFLLKEMPHKRAAHVLNFIDEIAVKIMRAKMIPHAIDLPRATAPISGPSEDVNLMPLTLKCRRQLRHMRRHPSYRHRMQRFPREHRYAHDDVTPTFSSALAIPICRWQKPVQTISKVNGSVRWFGRYRPVPGRCLYALSNRKQLFLNV